MIKILSLKASCFEKFLGTGLIKWTLMCSGPSKAVCREIGPALWKIGSTDFLRMSKKDAFSWQFSKFSAKANDFGARTPPILSNLGELAQAQKP